MRVQLTTILVLLAISVLVLTLGCQPARTDDDVERLAIAIAELTEVVEKARGDINTLTLQLAAPQDALHSLEAASEPDAGDDWEAVRANATPQMAELVRNLAYCRADGFGNYERVADYLEESTWREIAMGKPIGNPSAIVNLMVLHYCSTMELPKPHISQISPMGPS